MLLLLHFAAYMINTCLYDNNDRPCVVLKNVRVTGYQGAAQVTDELEREPMLRLLWKPDVTTLSSDGLAQYLSSYKQVSRLAPKLFKRLNIHIVLLDWR
jgi:hypothetical protein